MRKRHASCKPSKNPPDTLVRICRHCDAIHACESSRDGRSMTWHPWQRAAAFSIHQNGGLTETVRHSSSWWRSGAWTNGVSRLHACALRPDMVPNFLIIDNHQHDQSACLGDMWPLGQSRLLPAHLQTTVACASPRPVVPLALPPCLPSRHSDLCPGIPVSPTADCPTLKASLFRKYEACLG